MKLIGDSIDSVELSRDDRQTSEEISTIQTDNLSLFNYINLFTKANRSSTG